MSTRHHHGSHRPNVSRLPRSLGAYRWKAECSCGFWRATTFWRAALVNALLHANGAR